MQKYIWTAIFIAAIIGVVIWAKADKAPVATSPVPDSAVEEPPVQPSEESTTPITSHKTTLINGMTIETTKEGSGPAIKSGQTASVQYEGKLADGSIFDSTAKHGGAAFDFALGQGMVIKGWDEGVLGMKVGETRILTIPPALGYGAGGYPPIIPANATLIFTVTLQGIK